MDQKKQENKDQEDQQVWDDWAKETFSEEKSQEAQENISNILAKQKQRERGSPIIFEVDEDMETRADLYRKYDFDDPTGERQENFCN